MKVLLFTSTKRNVILDKWTLLKYWIDQYHMINDDLGRFNKWSKNLGISLLKYFIPFKSLDSKENVENQEKFLKIL